MLDLLASIFQFLAYVWRGIGAAMQLNPRVFEIVESYPQSRWVVLTIALLGGASLLIGQSVILFVNRVRPRRFVASLLLNGVVFGIGLIVWAVMIWLTARIGFGRTSDLGSVIRLVALGAAAYIFGFLVLIPYLGTFIGRVLAVWSFLIVLSSVNYHYQFSFWQGLICVGVGWLLITLLSATIGRPVIALRNWLWHRVTGSDLNATVQDLLLDLASEPANGSSIQKEHP